MFSQRIYLKDYFTYSEQKILCSLSVERRSQNHLKSEHQDNVWNDNIHISVDVRLTLKEICKEIKQIQ